MRSPALGLHSMLRRHVAQMGLSQQMGRVHLSEDPVYALTSLIVPAASHFANKIPTMREVVCACACTCVCVRTFQCRYFHQEM